MKKWFMIVLLIFGTDAFAVVHKFSPEFQAIYDAAKMPEVQKAQRKGAKAKIIYKIVDDEGKPLANHKIGYIWQNDYPRKIWGGYAITDSKGMVVLKDKVGGKLKVAVSGDGHHYGAWDEICFHWRKNVSPLVKDGRWQPYGEYRTLVVKRIKNPIEMKFHNWGFDGCPAPATNVWIGLDLEVGQWCKPYGSGKHEDVMVRFRGTIVDDFTWDTQTELSFNNNPYAGFYVMQKDMYSSMSTCYAALTNDTAYVEKTIKLISKGRKDISPNGQAFDKIPADKYLVFRTRCIVDEKNRLVSAHYGKINGEFGGLLKLLFFPSCYIAGEAGIYFNSTPNDTNLEDVRNARIASGISH